MVRPTSATRTSARTASSTTGPPRLAVPVGHTAANTTPTARPAERITPVTAGLPPAGPRAATTTTTTTPAERPPAASTTPATCANQPPGGQPLAGLPLYSFASRGYLFGFIGTDEDE